MTIFGEIPPLWQNLQSYGQISRDYLVFNQNMAKYSTFFWQILYTFGQIFIDVNGQMLKNNLAIWSHWSGIKINELKVSFGSQRDCRLRLTPRQLQLHRRRHCQMHG